MDLVTYFKNVNVAFQDTPSLDAFNRLRTSDPYTLFACSHDVSINDEFWENVITGSATVTHLPNEAAVRLRTSVASGDKVVRTTRRYFRYNPGKSQMILLTGTVGAPVTNVVRQWGYFDDRNGIFFQQTSSGVSVVRRSYVTGTAVDVAVAQTSWNVDKFDGNGPSGVTLDWTKAQVFVIDLAWLGVSRARVGVVINGIVYYGHQFLNANNLSTVYMSTASLPVRYVIENVGVADAVNDFHAVCVSVVSEGGDSSALAARLRSASNGSTPVSISTRKPVLSIKPKTVFNNVVNRAYIQPVDIMVNNGGQATLFVEVVRNGVLTNPSFVSASASSTVEYDVSASAVTGGEVIWSGYVTSANNGGRVEIPLDSLANSDIPLTVDAAGAVSVPLSVVATSLSAACNTFAAVTWKEIY